jgi:hypothetical protein
MCSELISADSGIIGVSPSVISFNDVLRGGYAERPITISYSGDQQISVNLSAEGEISNWLNFTNNVFVSKNGFARPIVSVSPPSDMPNGNYTGFIVISVSSSGTNGQEGKAVSKVISVLRLAINVEVTDRETVTCTASSFFIDSVEKGDNISMHFDVLNSGNIRLKPEINVKIWDPEQNYVIKEVNLRGQEILPTRTQSLNFSIASDGMDPSQYWASVEVPQCYASDTLTFDILEEGALKSNLVLLKIYSMLFGKAGETLPIFIDYQNIGEKQVDAQFRGQIALDGKIVQLLNSDTFTSPINEKDNMTLYFTPQKGGQYVVSGRIFYDKKKTFEENTIINVLANANGWNIFSATIPYTVTLIIIALIVFLIVKIRREREAYIAKLRMMRIKR